MYKKCLRQSVTAIEINVHAKNKYTQNLMAKETNVWTE